MSNKFTSSNLNGKTLSACIALVVGFTLSVGPSIGSYGAALLIALPIAISLHKQEKNKLQDTIR